MLARFLRNCFRARSTEVGNTLEQRRERSTIDRDRPRRRHSCIEGPDHEPRIETLVEQAPAALVLPQELHPIAFRVDEDENAVALRVLRQLLGDDDSEAVD